MKTYDVCYNHDGEYKAVNECILRFTSDNFGNDSNLQNVYTPRSLVESMVGRVIQFTDLKGKTVLVYNLEFANYLINYLKVEDLNIIIHTDSTTKKNWADKLFPTSITIINTEILKHMKFDVIIGNPPYQTPSGNKGTNNTLWDKFVKKSFEILKDDGYICFVHPSGWRANSNSFKDAKILKDKQIEYLEIHSEQDGCKTFGATTRYDWYVVKNCPISSNTVIKDQEGYITNKNLADISFIPNSQLDYIYSLLAKNGEERVEILYSRSDYGSDKKHTCKIEDEIHKYPVVYSVSMAGPTIWYSSINNGHFGIPKIIINPRRPIGYVEDINGDYGISEFCVGIVGDEEYLKMVANVIKNQKTNGFSEFMETCHLTDKIFNKDIISLFRKDFWKDFI